MIKSGWKLGGLIWIASAIVMTGCSEAKKDIYETDVEVGTVSKNEKEKSEKTTESEEKKKEDSPDTETPAPTVERNVKSHYPIVREWLVRLKAKRLEDGVVFKGAQLGYTSAKSDAVSGTLVAFGGKGARLEILFEENNRTTSTLLRGGNEKKMWPFVVVSDDPNATVTLYWTFYAMRTEHDASGRIRRKVSYLPFHPSMKKMTLTDTDEARTIPVSMENGVSSYTFSMDGKTYRRFEWKADVENADTTVSIRTGKMKRNIVKIENSSLEKSGNRKIEFDPNRPPFLQDGRR
jgi:hypothetical protein